MAPTYLLVWKRPRPRSVRQAVSLLTGLTGIERDESLAQIDPTSAGLMGVEVDPNSDFPRDRLRSFVIRPGTNGAQELEEFCVKTGLVLFDPLNQRLLVPAPSRAQSAKVRVAASELAALAQVPIVDGRPDPIMEDQVAANLGYAVQRDLSLPPRLVSTPIAVPSELRIRNTRERSRQESHSG